MRYPLVFILIIVCFATGRAQVIDADSLLNREQKFDSLKQKISSLDNAGASTQHRMDSLLARTQNADSVVLKPEQKLNVIQQNFYQASDSLKFTYKAKLSGLDKAGVATQHLIDSLTSLHLPTEKYTHKLDSINQEKNAAIHSLDQKMDALKSKTTGQLKQFNFPPELNDKVSAVTKNVEGFKLPVKDLNISSLNLPDNPLKSLDGLNSSIKTSFGEVGNISNLQGLNGSLKNIGQVGNIDGLKGLQNNLGDVSKVTGQMGNYQQDIQNVTKGNLGELKAAPKALETKAADVAGIKDLQKQAGGVMDPLKQVTGQVQNPEAAKEQALQKVQEVAVNHFAGKEEVLQQAMNKVAKYKQKYSSLNSLSEIGKKRPNEMHGKPFIERVVPGISFQILKKGRETLVDFNPYIGYRFTGRITAGPGWNQRISFDHPSRVTRIYGPRVFGEFKLAKGISPRVEFDMMNTNVPARFNSANSDPFARRWVYTMMIGFKKEYRFFKMIKGTAYIMTIPYDPHHTSPYGDRVITRFGFEFPMKKKK